jgi:hypothetical protein
MTFGPIGSERQRRPTTTIIAEVIAYITGAYANHDEIAKNITGINGIDQDYNDWRDFLRHPTKDYVQRVQPCQV